MTRRSMKRAAASVRWTMLCTQVPSPVKAPDVWLDVYIVQSNADDSHVVGFTLQTGEDTCRQGHRSDSERAGPRLRPPDGTDPLCADAFARRVPHARGVIATNPRVAFGPCVKIDARKHPHIMDLSLIHI